MVGAIRKLGLNFGWRAYRTLGVRQYIRLLGVVLRSLPSIVRSGDLRPVDRRMGRSVVNVRFQGRRFRMDCPAVDAIVQDGTYSFGIIREMFIRNCYVRHGVAKALEEASYVLDLGANRGTFSVMAAMSAKKVIAVEVIAGFIPAINANLKANQLDNVVVESAFVGEGGDNEDDATVTRTIPQMIAEHAIPRFDLVKIDIEGSEFGLFDNADWLDRCSAVCMEVHPAHGDVAQVLSVLASHGFQTQVADHTFRPIAEVQSAEFVWAWKSAG